MTKKTKNTTIKTDLSFDEVMKKIVSVAPKTAGKKQPKEQKKSTPKKQQ